MEQVYPDASLVPSLKRLVSPEIYYWLYGNDVTPDDTTVVGTFTLPWTEHQLVVVASFTLGGVTAHLGRIVASDVAFTNTTGGSQNVYGYFVTDAISSGLPGGNLVCAARFDSAPVVVLNGDLLFITPTLALKQA